MSTAQDPIEQAIAENAPGMPWDELVGTSQRLGLFAQQLYAITSRPTKDFVTVLKALPGHLEYQNKLETDGTMFAAGPLADPETGQWTGEGMFVYRASSEEEAAQIAAADPMHSSGARSFTIRTWCFNEGTANH